MKTIDEYMDEVNFPKELRPLAKAIYAKESSSGKQDTSKPNYAGAVGGMQVTQPTFDGLKKAGWIPDTADLSNPDDAVKAGLANVVALANQYDGDVKKVAAAYYSGPKAIKSDGSIKPLRDPKNPQAPNTQQYANDIARKTNQQETAPADSGTETPGAISTDENGFSQFIAGKRTDPRMNAPGGKKGDNTQSLLDQLQASSQTASPPPDQQQAAAPAPDAAPVDAAPAPAASAPAPGERTLAQKAGRVGLETLGGMLGGSAGTFVEPGGGTVVGAGLGSAAGSKVASATFDPLPEDQANKEATLAGIFGAAGPLIGKVGKAAFKARGLVKGGAELMDILAQKGITPVPSQVFDSQGLNILENLGEASLIGSGSLKAAKQAAVTGVRDAAEAYKTRWLDSLQTGQRMLSQVADQAAAKNVQIDMSGVRNAADTMRKVFSNVDSPARKVADDLYQLTQRNQTLPFAVTMKDALARNAAAAAQQQATGIASNPALIGAQQIRANLLDVIRSSSNQNEVNAARETVKALDGAISQSLAAADPSLHAAWRMGNAFYRAGKQGEEISTIMSKSLVSGGETGEIGGKQLLNQIKEHRLASLGTDLTDQQVQRLSDFGNALKASEGSGDHAFQFVSRGLQLSAVVQIGAAATGGVLAASGDKSHAEAAFVVALGPVALAKVFSSPRTFKLLLAAMRAKAGTRAGAAAGTAFVLQGMKEGIITSPEAQQAADLEQNPQ